MSNSSKANQAIYLSLNEQIDLIVKRKISSYDLTTAYVEHIKLANGDLNILIRENFDDALMKASKLDKFLIDEGSSPPHLLILPKWFSHNIKLQNLAHF